MPPVPYTLATATTEQSLAAWGIRADLTWRFANKEKDQVTLNTIEPFDPAAPQFPWGSAVTIFANRTLTGSTYSAGTILFQGYVGQVRTSATGSRQAIGYELYGPWWLLTRLQFKQARNIFAGWIGGLPANGPSFETAFLAETFLGEDPAQAMWTGAQQLTEILNFANECWNPTKRGATSGRDNTQDILQIGAIDCAQIFPKTRAQTVSCAEAIIQVLRYFPTTVAWFDYTTTPPTLHLRDLANLTAVSQTISANQERDIALAPQYDRQLAGVILAYKKVDLVAGQPWPNIYTDKYPPAITDYTPNVLTHVIEIPGYKTTGMKATVAVQSLAPALSATPSDRAAFWTALDTTLQDPLVDPDSIECGQPLSITDPTGVAVNPASFPNILLPGSEVSSWMQVNWVHATIQVQVSFNKYHDPARAILADKVVNRLISYRVILTNAVSGPYSGQQLQDSGELVPPLYPAAGSLALALYQSLSRLQYQGSVTFVATSLRTDLALGEVLTLIGPINTYPNLIIQALESRPHYGEMRVEFGPSARIDASALVEMWRASRWRTTYNLPSGRSSGQASVSAQVDTSGAGQKENTAHGLGTFSVRSATFDQGSVGGSPNGVTVIQHHAPTEALTIQRLSPVDGDPITADGSGNPVGKVHIALPDTGGKTVAIQTLPDGSKVVASPDFTGGTGSGASLYYFVGFAVPSTDPHNTGQQLLNASPNGTLQTLILACPWNAAWTTADHPIAAQPKVYIALPEHLRDTIASDLVPDLTGPATSGTVTYGGYTFALQGGGAYFDQYRTATPPSGSGLPTETQFITLPYKVGDFIWAVAANTGINIQINSGDAITGATVVAGGTGYKVGDTISVSGGTGTPPTFTVAAISGGGSTGPITTVSLVTVGALFGGAVNPMAVTGGSGSAASLNMSYVLVALRDTNVAGRSWGD